MGGALGSVARYAVGVAALRLLGPAWPLGTLAVNVVGSALVGLFAGALAAGAQVSAEARLLLVAGVLGGFTTFSAFSLDTGALWARSAGAAALYVGATLAGGLGAFAAAFALARRAMG